MDDTTRQTPQTEPQPLDDDEAAAIFGGEPGRPPLGVQSSGSIGGDGKETGEHTGV